MVAVALNLTDKIKKYRQDYQNALGDKYDLSNPNSPYTTLATVNATQDHSILEYAFEYLKKVFLPQFITENDGIELLEVAGSRETPPLTRKLATKSIGYIVIQGSPQSYASGVFFTSIDGYKYKTLDILNIASNSFNINIEQISLTTAKATITNTGLIFIASGMKLSISSTNTNYVIANNIITAIAENEFLFNTSNIAIGTIATGVASADFGYVKVESEITGSLYNQNNGAIMTPDVIITNYQNSFVTYAGLYNGSDDENFASFKARLLDYIKNPTGNYTPSAIKNFLLSNTVATRIWVINPSSVHNAGNTQIYIVDDNSNKAFTNVELQNFKQLMLDKLYIATAPPSWLFIENPTLMYVKVIINNLQPTFALTEIEKSLKYHFAENSKIGYEINQGGALITEDTIRLAILNTIYDNKNSRPQFSGIDIYTRTSLGTYPNTPNGLPSTYQDSDLLKLEYVTT